MKIAGLTAEFNPLHNGHCWLLKQARERHDIDAVICVMGGSFLQRGEAAVCNKWARAEMAVRAGCDLVIELPFCFAVRSAWYFAHGAVSLLDRLGICTHLLFGAENEDGAWMQQAAAILTEENQEFKQLLRAELDAGHSFAVARAAALQKMMGDAPGLAVRLAQPNNILAIEYLRSLQQLRSPLIPVILPRRGGAYHSHDGGPQASAAAIRHWLLQAESAEREQNLRIAMPPFAYDILQAEIAAGRAPLRTGDLSPLLLWRLRQADAGALSRLCEMDEGLEYRVKQAAEQAGDRESLRHAIKSKRYSLSRIDRLLLYALLDFTAADADALSQAGPQYLHVLAFSPAGRDLMKQISRAGALPLLTRGSAVKALCENADASLAAAMLRLDVKATDLHSLLYPHAAERRSARDFTTSALPVEMLEKNN